MSKRQFLAPIDPLLDGSISAAERPNLVFILADNLGYGDLGKRPVLKLAADATR